jgi:hypothetical protein
MLSVNSRLELHLADGCNLHCRGCNHFSDFLKGGLLSLEDARAQLEPWSKRIALNQLTLLGGEPALNPQLVSIIRLARQLFPTTPISVVTNGFLLNRHADLGVCLLESDVLLNVSIHSRTFSYAERFEAVARLLDKWKSMGVSINVWESWKFWISVYRGTPPDLKPFAEGSPRTSWKACKAVSYRCAQLRNGCIWKCPLVAYLPLVKQASPDLDSRWSEALEYLPLEPTATDGQILEFFSREEESVCGLCPSTTPEFEGGCE